MKELNEENFIELINEYEKNVLYNDIEWKFYKPLDDFTFSIKQIFYKDDSAFADEYIPDQNLLINDDYLFFQIPLDDRKYGIVRGSIEIQLPDYTIIDDEHGNLYEETDEDREVQIGNIFYDTGCIFITTDDNFLNTSDNVIGYIQSKDNDLYFDKYVQFIERSIVIDISEGDFISTVNETWSGDEPLFFNKIYLYNEDYDVVAVGNLSKNTPFKKQITILLDSTEVY